MFNNNYVIIMSLMKMSRDLYQTLRFLIDFVTDKISTLNHSMFEINTTISRLTQKMDHKSRRIVICPIK